MWRHQRVDCDDIQFELLLGAEKVKVWDTTTSDEGDRHIVHHVV